MNKLPAILWLMSLAVTIHAQETTEPVTAQADENPAPAQPRPSGEATISLQTTVTGNQEQPRVLYILPWQSPLTGDIEFQSMSRQKEEVFGHLEREELRRSLEAEAVFSKSKH